MDRERTCFIYLTNHEREEIIIPAHMDAIDISSAMPPNIHNLVGKGVRYHPSHKPPKIVTLRNPIFHRYLIDRYIQDGYTPIEYVRWLEDFRDAALPGHLVIESGNFVYDTDMPVLIDFETRSVEHGQEDNIPYALTFYEFIDEKVETIGQPPTGQEYPAPEPPIRDEIPPPVPRTHTVISGDSLWAITRQYLGSGARWRELYELNQEVIWERADPGRQGNLIFPGQTFRIPADW